MENRKSGFRIGMEDEGPESYIRTGKDKLQAKLENRRLDKINNRITLITFLIFCLIGAVFFAGYLEREKRFDQILNQINSFEAQKPQTISKDIADKLAVLSEKYDKLEKSLNQKDEPLNEVFLVFEKTSASLKQDLTKIEQSIEQINTDKADKTSLEHISKNLTEEFKKLSDQILKINQTVNPAKDEFEKIRAEIDTAKNELKSIDEKFTAQLSSFNETSGSSKEDFNALTKEIKQVKKDVVDVLSDTIDKTALNRAIQNQERRYKKELDFVIKTIGDKDKSIRSLQRTVQILESRIKSLAKSQLGTPKPGTVLEQDL